MIDFCLEDGYLKKTTIETLQWKPIYRDILIASKNIIEFRNKDKMVFELSDCQDLVKIGLLFITHNTNHIGYKITSFGLDFINKN